MSAPLLRRGDKGPAVADWQRQLVELGYKLIIDGDFGPLTDAATRAFQGSRGLVVDGIVGPKTRAAAQTPSKGAPASREVPKVATPLTEAQLVDVLRAGHVIAFGAEPSMQRLACAWAQNALEHARGRAVYCHNIGNITTGSGWHGPYYVIRVQERVQKNPDVWREIDMRFRAHDAPEDGAADYWSVMSRRYSAALALFDQGQAHAAALELGARGYYTAHEDQYARSMASLYREARERLVTT